MSPIKKLLIGCVIAGVLMYLLVRYLGAPATFDNPAVSQWQPTHKSISRVESKITPDQQRFYTLHGDTHNSDELSIAVSPAVQVAWTTETHLYVAEGPTEDNQGNLYFSPIYPQENVVLVALDPQTGARRWAISATSTRQSAGGGAPLILNDPDNPGQQLIYLGVYDRAVAVRQNGEVVWDVATGLQEPDVQAGESDSRHVFGLNYHPQADALVGLTAAGEIYVLDRSSGKPLLDEPHRIEGAPGKSESGGPGKSLAGRVDAMLDNVFGPLEHNEGRFSSIMQALFGGGFKVSNYFAIDKNSGRIFIAATAPDGTDGQVDGVSSYGSLYAYDLLPAADDMLQLVTVGRRDFKGGTGASPALNADGTRVYTADNDRNVLAFDRDLNPIWSITLGQTIPASISVSSENNELYAVSFQSIFKLIDRGPRAELMWESELTTFPELGPYQNFNMTTATIVANGIAVSVGAGLTDGSFALPLRFGVGLLDRETGKLLAYNPGIEESVSVTMVSADGGYYLANSPVRRAVVKTLMGPLVEPLQGGISRYKPVRPDLLARQAACSAIKRQQASMSVEDEHQKTAFAQHAQVLAEQANQVAGDKAGKLEQQSRMIELCH